MNGIAEMSVIRKIPEIPGKSIIRKSRNTPVIRKIAENLEEPYRAPEILRELYQTVVGVSSRFL